MTVLVRPKRLYVEEGTTVLFHCLVLTDAPNRTSIKWQMSSSKVKRVPVTGTHIIIEPAHHRENQSTTIIEQ